MRKLKATGLHLPIRVHLSTAFVLSLLIVGVLLGWFHYNKLTELLLESSERVSDRIADKVVDDFNVSHDAIASTVAILAASPLVEADTLQQRFDHLLSLKLAVDSQPDATAIQVGYEDGDYFIVRKLNTEAIRQRFEAPDDAVIVVDNLEVIDGEGFIERFFFDDSLLQVDYRAMGSSNYDPRKRPWFELAQTQPSVLTTPPYLFFFIGEVGMTVVRASEFGQQVVGADITLSSVSRALGQSSVSPSSQMYIVSEQGAVLASRIPQAAEPIRTGVEGLPRLAEVNSAPLQSYLSWLQGAAFEAGPSQYFKHSKSDWLAVTRPLSLPGVTAHLLILTPEEELLQEAYALRDQSVMITGLIILVSVPLALFLAHLIASPLRELARETQRIIRFEYGEGIKLNSYIKEIYELVAAMGIMKQTIARFSELIRSVSAEKNFTSLLATVTHETMQVSHAEGALIYLLDEEGVHLRPMSLQTLEGSQPITHLDSFSIEDAEHPFSAGVQAEGVSVIKLNNDTCRNNGTCLSLRGLLHAEEVDAVLVPLRNRQQQKIGMLCLLFDSAEEEGEIISESSRIAFVNALSGFSAITIESRYLLKAQKELLESFMQLIAGAIDEKSPYTGGHCQRVPVLTKMLAEASCNMRDGPYADFALSEEEWEELHIAAWMHDCGKVTTPEYVVDKATKLETLYDRIHEIRMRFEVIKQTAAVAAWKRIAEGEEQSGILSELDALWQELDADWEFVAHCNKGSEGLSEEDAERLSRIAERTWTRTLDDRLGISWEEAQRREQEPRPTLPATEKLLEDRVHHIIHWHRGEQLTEDNPWGFRMLAPELKYNRGELYNLQVRRGTLTEEERFIINNHIVQTIVMLEKLPFPRHLRRVPEIAGGHHEKMDGTGYPKQLRKEDMPPTARMMAIADIFEALTASDRPYKEAKKLSVAITIMNRMRMEGHIDPELFEIFLRSGVYLDYARRFLAKEQIDNVDVDQVLAEA